jgi:hypothetical protein
MRQGKTAGSGQVYVLVVPTAYGLPLTAYYLMNRSFLGEMFKEGLANLALDVSWFFLGICCDRGVQQDLFDLFPVWPTEVHEAQDHTPLFFDSTTLALNH